MDENTEGNEVLQETEPQKPQADKNFVRLLLFGILVVIVLVALVIIGMKQNRTLAPNETQPIENRGPATAEELQAIIDARIAEHGDPDMPTQAEMEALEASIEEGRLEGYTPATDEELQAIIDARIAEHGDPDMPTQAEMEALQQSLNN